MKNFTEGDIFTIKGMKHGEVFNPEVFLIEPDSKNMPRYHIREEGALAGLIRKTKPFSKVSEVSFLPVIVSSSVGHCSWEEQSQGTLNEIESLDFFKRRIQLSDEQFLWAMFNLIYSSDNPDIKNGPLLNKGEEATYLLTSEATTLFQLIGSYDTKRGWNCALFYLDQLSDEDKDKPSMNKILIAI